MLKGYTTTTKTSYEALHVSDPTVDPSATLDVIFIVLRPGSEHDGGSPQVNEPHPPHR